MGIIGIILGIIAAIPKVISIIQEIVALIGQLKGHGVDPKQYVGELAAALDEAKRTKDVTRLEKLHARLRALLSGSSTRL